MSSLAFPLDNVRFEQDGVLVRRALDLLQSPTPTAEVAAKVLGIVHGNGAAAAAVFSLLGTDPRFAVSADGVWTLAAPRVPSVSPAPPPAARPPWWSRKTEPWNGEQPEQISFPLRTLRDEEWVVVDLETTGGSPKRGHRVTEVAAVCVSGGRITETYSSLVNPCRAIPRMITALTGISDTMVAAAPHFHEVAARVSETIAGRVFVAHNAAFDWRFLSHEMQQATGTTPAGRQLCTVRLARKLLPELPSRKLDALSYYFGVEIENRHRALDDAVATAKILLRLIDILEDRGASDWDALQVVLGKRAQRKKRTKSPKSMEAAW
ncbi:3'-5' exonuclease [Longimicrobium sp.]|uniref:3'-5' exonuclease n=1 Tax=Longimicrobium sp. TaxID=2029185 RepID=UPI002BF3A036|nr:exonuclease domain-containing protein [Longimicrobium sp.]HSU13944.1 exonuclease domain-containing protein [Longimicrobium sp.]